jgi:NAD(P)-dependent dehydrogenase (short-subunit alcohol dehydrogenase family)
MMNYSNNLLAGRKYLVTGGSSGLGQAAAILISKCGGMPIICGRNKEKLEFTHSLLNGEKLPFFVNNFIDADSTYDFVADISKKCGMLDGVFHSAGIEYLKPARLIKQADIELVYQSCLYPMFGIARAVGGKNIFNNGSSIVSMSSVATEHGETGLSVYASSKGAINAMIKSLACEFAAKKIRINGISAAAVETEMHARLLRRGSEDSNLAYESKHLLGFGSPIQIANVVIYLLSDLSSWVTGSIVDVDGGFSAK